MPQCLRDLPHYFDGADQVGRADDNLPRTSTDKPHLRFSRLRTVAQSGGRMSDMPMSLAVGIVL